METKPITSKEIIALLVEKYPQCFSLSGAAKPLKVGIFQDIAEQLTEEDVISKTRLRQALRHYTSSWRYLKSIKIGVQRVDLQGESVAEIDESQAEYARKILKESQDKFANKKAQDKEKQKSYKDKQANDKHPAKGKNKPDSKSADKFKSVKAKNSSKKIAKVELKPINNDSLTIGQSVKVQIGNTPMDATVTEVVGNDVSVQLSSGMVVKTQVKHLFTE